MFVYENGVFTAVPCTKKNSYLSIRDFAEGRDGTIYVASTSGVCRVRSGLLVPYSNPYITGETAYALGIDRYGRLWCAMSTGKCAVMQDDRVLAMLDAELFFEDGSVISCLTSDHANNIYLGHQRLNAGEGRVQRSEIGRHGLYSADLRGDGRGQPQPGRRYR